MKILFLWNPASINIYGGGEKVLSTVLSGLLEKGYDFRILVAVHGVNEIKNEHEWVEPFSLYRDKLFFHNAAADNLYNSIHSALAYFRPDIILIGNSPLQILVSYEILRITGIGSKIVYWDHGYLGSYFFYESLDIAMQSNDEHKARGEIIKSSFKLCDGFLAISSGITDMILSVYPNAKVYKIFNPINEYSGRFIDRPERPVFIYVGRLDNKQKNLSFMLYGMSRLRDADWRLDIIGSGPDESMLKNLSLKLCINDKIDWFGFKKEPFEKLEEVTALLLTSRFEGLPTALIEANQRGIPVVSSNCKTGPDDIVVQGKNGYLYKEGDINDFVKVIQGIISGDLCFDTSLNIAKTAEKFNGDSYMKRFTEALNALAVLNSK